MALFGFSSSKGRSNLAMDIQSGKGAPDIHTPFTLMWGSDEAPHLVSKKRRLTSVFGVVKNLVILYFAVCIVWATIKLIDAFPSIIISVKAGLVNWLQR